MTVTEFNRILVINSIGEYFQSSRRKRTSRLVRDVFSTRVVSNSSEIPTSAFRLRSSRFYRIDTVGFYCSDIPRECNSFLVSHT